MEHSHTDPVRPAGRSRTIRVVLAAAVGVTVLGLVLLVLGPIRASRDRAADDDRQQEGATVATCIRQVALKDRLADPIAPIGPEELRSRVADLAAGAVEARADVRDAATALQQQVVRGDQADVDASLAALTTACATP